MQEAPWPKAILFDLDGTLIDSAPDITAATNELLGLYALSCVTLDDVRGMIGNGLRKLVERAFAHHDINLTEQELDDRFEAMLKIFGTHLTSASRPYAGVDRMLRNLCEKGHKLALVTNKPERFIKPIVTHFEWNDIFSSIVGGDSLPTRKPEPQMLLHTCAAMGFAPKDGLMVGDNAADIDGARNAKIKSVAIRGGYTQTPADALGADYVIDAIADLPQVLSSMK